MVSLKIFFFYRSHFGSRQSSWSLVSKTGMAASEQRLNIYQGLLLIEILVGGMLGVMALIESKHSAQSPEQAQNLRDAVAVILYLLLVFLVLYGACALIVRCEQKIRKFWQDWSDISEDHDMSTESFDGWTMMDVFSFVHTLNATVVMCLILHALYFFTRGKVQITQGLIILAGILLLLSCICCVFRKYCLRCFAFINLLLLVVICFFRERCLRCFGPSQTYTVPVLPETEPEIIGCGA